jgi:hypothetical protein
MHSSLNVAEVTADGILPDSEGGGCEAKN